ncbi:MAG: ABC transporter permease, partial [Fimbriiglobus sp.]
RDVKLRYAQTALGVGWAVFQPAATVLVFAVFLGWLGGAAKGKPAGEYALFVLAGVLPWTLFANGVTTAANSLLANERLVTKTYFPRLLLPVSCVLVAVFDFLVGAALLVGWAAIAGVIPTANLLVAPFAVGAAVLAAAGVGVLLSALIVAQRDFRHLVAFGMPLWMFATPCIYMPAEQIAPAARAWLPLNPAYGPVQAFRAAVLGEPLDGFALVVSAAVAAVVAAVSLAYFYRVEQTMADTI